MISGPIKMMYLRPGNLKKDFMVKSKVSKTIDGNVISEFLDTGIFVRGILAEVDSKISDRKKHMWDQDQHSLTHTVICSGGPVSKMGDLLIQGERSFFVLLVDNPGELNITTIYYVEERIDLK